MRGGLIALELTKHCNLRCLHCLREDLSTKRNLPPGLIKRVLEEAKAYRQFTRVCFTGGEPTLHPELSDILEIVQKTGYTWSVVTNGSTFPRIYPKLLPYKGVLDGICFSLDGAREETHDRIRGKGSYRQVMRAVSVCVIKDIPFTLQMSVNRSNRLELEEMAFLATRLRSRGLRFAHLMPTPQIMEHSLDLSLEEGKEVGAEVERLKCEFDIPIGIAPGDYKDFPLSPCAPLKLLQLNVDCEGNLTFCCNLSSYAGGTKGTDIIGNLNEMSFHEAYKGFIRAVGKHLELKAELLGKGGLGDLEHYPCLYCAKYFSKVNWMEGIPNGLGNGIKRIDPRRV